MSPLPDDFLGPENLRKLLPAHPDPGSSPAPRIRGQFLRGPIPLDWLAKAAKLPGKAPLAVALAIRFEAGRRGSSRAIRLPNPLAAKFGVSRKSKYSALSALRAAGLIAVNQEPKKAPLVTILEVADAPNF